MSRLKIFGGLQKSLDFVERVVQTAFLQELLVQARQCCTMYLNSNLILRSPALTKAGEPAIHHVGHAAL
jgi:hypothetical protein